MPTDHPFDSALRLAALLESTQQYDAAETAYRQALAAAEAADPADRSLVGTLHINVGNVARYAGRFDDAITWYRKAADLLEGLKGEALLQRGYAFVNLATLLLHKDDPEAVPAAAEALRLHRAYPYTPKADLADAVALQTVTRLFLQHEMSEDELTAAWHEVQAVPCRELQQNIVFDLVLNYLLVIRKIHPDRYPEARAEVEQWALPVLFEEIVADVEGGPEKYQAMKLQHRLQRALFGIPPREGE